MRNLSKRVSEKERRNKMPALIGVSDFVEETTADYKSPITSSFVSRMQNMKQTIATLEEVSAKINFDSLFHLSIIHHRHHHPLHFFCLLSRSTFAYLSISLNKMWKCHQNPINVVVNSIYFTQYR